MSGCDKFKVPCPYDYLSGSECAHCRIPDRYIYAEETEMVVVELSRAFSILIDVVGDFVPDNARRKLIMTAFVSGLKRAGIDPNFSRRANSAITRIKASGGGRVGHTEPLAGRGVSEAVKRERDLASVECAELHEEEELDDATRNAIG